MHAKVAIVDDRWLTVGSANLNEHSLFNDTEINIATCDPMLARHTRLALWAEHLDRTVEEIDHDPTKERLQVSDHASSSTVTQVAQTASSNDSPAPGYIVSGLLHLTIGYLAIRIALGSGGGSADQSGALAAVATKPGGIVALWVAAALPTSRPIVAS